ncbi:hypothetical protein [Roseivirga sp. UBA838]|uniref:hypothetical protein n=1 Tax=Roseivirga sp. UBA838 TaxID=1947393 RepID=UPI00257B7D46|nr:hypothetical protein [Roseivirga sp. UBA838]|tara:strand:+ start:1150 stop:2451 length:1302 start_codon:yes stop_codon:yes gene_type:complete
MAYTLNDIDLTDYGIIPAKGSRGNIALAGFLDLPQRMGKSYHVWAEDDGPEAWADASLIGYEGRDLTLSVIIRGSDLTEAQENIHALYDAMTSFTDLVELGTPYGTFNVLVKDAQALDYIGHNYFRGELRFREPQPVLSGIIPTEPNPSALENSLDGILLSTLSLTYLEWKNENNRSAVQPYELPTYLKEGYKTTLPAPHQYELKCLLLSENIASLITKAKAINAIWLQAGTRDLVINEVSIASCIAPEGISYSDITVEDSRASAIVTMQITQMDEQFTTLLADGDGFALADELGTLIALGNKPAPVVTNPIIQKTYIGTYTAAVAVSTEDITLSGEQTVNGVELVEDQVVYVRAQTDPTENKLYRVKLGAWEALAVSYDGLIVFAFDGLIYVTNGDTYATSDEEITDNLAAGSVIVISYPAENLVQVQIRQQ